jgi:hypothetical protein
VQSTGTQLFVARQLEQLRQLRISTLTAADCRGFLDRFPTLNLRELAIHGMTRPETRLRYERIHWQGPAFDELVASPAFARLEALDLYDHSLDTPERIGQMLATARLRDLRIGEGGGSTRAACLAIGRHPRAAALEILDVYSVGLETDLADFVMSPHLQNLRALRICEGTRQAGFEEGARAIGQAFRQLKILDLSRNAFGRFMQDLLVGNGLAQLEVLALRGSALDDDHARTLADSRVFSRLRVLDLRDNQLTPSGAFALTTAMPPTLELLDLRGNQIGRDVAKDLRKKFRTTRVLAGKK